MTALPSIFHSQRESKPGSFIFSDESGPSNRRMLKTVHNKAVYFHKRQKNHDKMPTCCVSKNSAKDDTVMNCGSQEHQLEQQWSYFPSCRRPFLSVLHLCILCCQSSPESFCSLICTCLYLKLHHLMCHKIS